MPAYASSALGAKLVTFYPGNAGMPTHHAIIALFRPETGEPIALMDGRLITEMRTAAASAVATDLLARPEPACSRSWARACRRQSSPGGALALCEGFARSAVFSPRNAGAFAALHGVQAAGRRRTRFEVLI
jgi:hypothetical protein